MDIYSHYYGAGRLAELHAEASRQRLARSVTTAGRRPARARVDALLAWASQRFAAEPASTSVCCA